MPAEIDTSGRRVLHCDYRADCPLPILLSTSSKKDELLLRFLNPIIESSHERSHERSQERHHQEVQVISEVSNRRSCTRSRHHHHHHHHLHHHHHHHHQRRRSNVDLTKDPESILTNENVITNISGPCTSITTTPTVNTNTWWNTATTTTRTTSKRFSNRRSLSCSLETIIHRRLRSRTVSLPRKFRDRSYQRTNYSSSFTKEDRKLYSCKNFSNNDRTFSLSSSISLSSSSSSSCLLPVNSRSRVIQRNKLLFSSHRSRSFSYREKEPLKWAADRSSSLSNNSSSYSHSSSTGRVIDYKVSHKFPLNWFTKSSESSSSSSLPPPPTPPPPPQSSSSFSFSSSSSRSSRFVADTKYALKQKCRFYFQLAFLLFLLAFGHSGLLKSSVLKFSAKSSSLLSSSSCGINPRKFAALVAIGSIVGSVVVSAAPIDLITDAGVRAERSANLSHITGASRKIQMYIKNRHLQILPDGTVNGSNDDTSDYTIFQRMSVSRGQLRIQGVATCLYLCMDSCGLLYGSRDYTEDCVFNETLEQHNYNTYSSVKWSTGKKTLYLGLNRHGQPRRVQAKDHTLGRLSTYARVLTQVAPPDRVEALQRKMLGAEHNVRHRHGSHAHRQQHRHNQEHHQGDLNQQQQQQTICPNLPAQEKDGRDKFRCRKRKKRKKRKRRCRPGEKVGPQCQLPEDREISSTVMTLSSEESKRSCEGAASEEACRRQALSATSRKRKSRIGEESSLEAPGEDSSTSSNITETDDAPMDVPTTSPLLSSNTTTTITATHEDEDEDEDEEEEEEEEEEELLTTSIGKNLVEQATSKKSNVAGTISQSKKPDLLDGKKRKKMKKKKNKRKRGPAWPKRRRNPLSRKKEDGATVGEGEEKEEEEETIEEATEKKVKGKKRGKVIAKMEEEEDAAKRREAVMEIPLGSTTISSLSLSSFSSASSSNHSSSFGVRSSPKRKTTTKRNSQSKTKNSSPQRLVGAQLSSSSKNPRKGKAFSAGSRRSTTPILLRQKGDKNDQAAASLDSSTSTKKTKTKLTRTMTTTTTTMMTTTMMTMTTSQTTKTITTKTIVPETGSKDYSNFPPFLKRASCCVESNETSTTTTNTNLPSPDSSFDAQEEDNESNTTTTERLLGFERLAM